MADELDLVVIGSAVSQQAARQTWRARLKTNRAQTLRLAGLL